MNRHEEAFIADLRRALAGRTDPTEQERYLITNQIAFIEEGAIGLTGPDTADEFIERYRDHYP